MRKHKPYSAESGLYVNLTFYRLLEIIIIVYGYASPSTDTTKKFLEVTIINLGKDIYLTLTFLLTITSFVIVLVILGYDSSVYAGRAIVNASKPVLNDPNLTVDLVFSGLKKPTSMIFLGPDDVLVAQKNEGTVERIVNG
ncbi:MAG: hypothetical protein M3P28_03520, partial [Thermoproteota archaeon]|nr:hypothetical protein [Thermoproteota archaeon]